MKTFLKHSEFKKLECCMALFPFLYTFFLFGGNKEHKS